MSDMFKYDVGISPNPLPIGLDVTLSDTALTATVSSVPDVSMVLSPTGSFIQKVVSGVLTPLADFIALFLRSKPRDLLQGKQKTLMSVGGYNFEGVEITPSALSLGSYTPSGGAEMLEVTGALVLTPTV